MKSKITSINPATEEANGTYELYSEEKINEILKNSEQAFLEWSNLGVSKRAEYLANVADVLRKRKSELGKIITGEMGKPIKQAVGEIEKCAGTFEYFSKNAEELMQPEIMESDAKNCGIYFEPLGVILSIKPWNFPFWQAISFAAHALAGGNVILLKHSSYVPMCALEIEGVFREAGFPEGVYQTLLMDGKTASSLISRDEIAGVSFTGSTSAGKTVAEEAGRNMKKCILEMGGSDPFIVLDDADIEKAAKTGASSRYMNAGQTCISAKRFIVEEGVAEEFASKFVEATRSYAPGDPLDENTKLGPLVRDEQRILLEKQVNDAVSKGSKVIFEGGKTNGKGFYYSPVVLTDVPRDSRVMREETFGPVVPIITVKDEKEAVEVANGTRFGLGATICSQDEGRAHNLGKQLNAGTVFVNSVLKPEPQLPFGGIKDSGTGRELSRFGFYEFMNIKTMKEY
ncbi:MAG: NAD-dependent succinate-semialdehyde dehydrogenase [Methanohalobium sp.]|uniref:NAD-dependent succinate-semialdehyde dehydrogenase n=1 Tax=Methanohalobium sp. TaxID=2837493 RepID=UPI00397AAEDA